MKTEKVFCSLRAIAAAGEALTPLMEGPAAGYTYQEDDDDKNNELSSWLSMKSWMVKKRSSSTDPHFLLAVLGCPLAPVSATSEPLPHLSIKDVAIELSSAQYIVHQYIAATGATRLHTSFHNTYIAGKVKMLKSKPESAIRMAKIPTVKSVETGSFVLWQMMPNKWYMELGLEGSMIQAGSNGKLVWRYTPWHGALVAKGSVRPLRRVLQGLNPMVTAHIFANARCIGEKRIGNEDCFVLKVAIDQSTLSDRSDSSVEIIRHVVSGCFSHKTGYLVSLEDSHLMRVQDVGGSNAVYWEATIESTLKDYRNVDGVVVAHAGKSVMTLYRFGEEVMSHTKTRLEETWSIDEVAFNVEGLSEDFFIPPSDILSTTSFASSHFPFTTSSRTMSINETIS